jgi:hypothetical protein
MDADFTLGGRCLDLRKTRRRFEAAARGRLCAAGVSVAAGRANKRVECADSLRSFFGMMPARAPLASAFVHERRDRRLARARNCQAVGDPIQFAPAYGIDMIVFASVSHHRQLPNRSLRNRNFGLGPGEIFAQVFQSPSQVPHW